MYIYILSLCSPQFMDWQERESELSSQLTPNPYIHRSDHNTVKSMPYSSRILYGLFNVPQNLHPRVMRRDLWLLALIREDLKVNHSQMSLQKEHLLLSYLKTLSVGPAGGAQPTEPPVRDIYSVNSLDLQTYLDQPKDRLKIHFRVVLSVVQYMWVIDQV